MIRGDETTYCNLGVCLSNQVMPNPKSTKLSQESFGFKDEDRKNPKHDDIVKWVHKNLDELVKRVFKARFGNEKHWSDHSLDRLSIEQPVWEHRIISDGKTPTIKGFIDIATTCYGFGDEKKIFFEAKTSIPSVGALIREIQFYKFYERGIYVVVSPDDTESSLLRTQQIEFIKYEE